MCFDQRFHTPMKLQKNAFNSNCNVRCHRMINFVRLHNLNPVSNGCGLPYRGLLLLCSNANYFIGIAHMIGVIQVHAIYYTMLTTKRLQIVSTYCWSSFIFDFPKLSRRIWRYRRGNQNTYYTIWMIFELPICTKAGFRLLKWQMIFTFHLSNGEVMRYCLSIDNWYLL